MGANSPKFRDFMVTINQGAEAYEDALERTKELNYKLYALIVHDKDKELSTDVDGQVIEKPKKTHKHIVLELKNPITFQSMQKKFPGAHIEQIRYKKSAYQYLIHNSYTAKEKYQYPITDIVSNSIDQVKFAIENENNELFKENMWLRYVAEGVRTPYQFTKRFGLNAYKQYWKPYSDMIENLPRDLEMQQDLEDIRKAMSEETPF